MKDFLTQQQVETLEQRHRQCREKRQADRIKTVLTLNRGYGYEEIARILLLDDSTLRNYYAEYVEGGVEGLLEDHYSGGSSRLSSLQLEELDNHLQEHTYQSSKEIVAHIEKTCGIAYSSEGVKDILQRLGYVYKKAKHIPGKADGKQQQEWIEKYGQIKASKKAEDVIYFMDGCHPLHNSVEAYGWIKKGTEKQLKANTGRERLNINGAYNAADHTVVVREDPQINAQSTIALIKQILVLHVIGMIYLIADNARYYRSREVEQFLKENPRVKMIFLPPYSPNLNLIERLWLFFKKKRLWNKYYEKFDDFKNESMSFFENIHLFKNELKSLMTDNFHILNTT